MTKKTITINVDVLSYETMRNMGVNISKELNDYMKSYISTTENDSEGIDVRLTQLQLEKNVKKMNHYQAQVKRCQAKLEKHEERQKEEQTQELQKKKEEYDALHRCKNCGTMINEGFKKHKFAIGYICNSCFLTSDPKKIKEWVQ